MIDARRALALRASCFMKWVQTLWPHVNIWNKYVTSYFQRLHSVNMEFFTKLFIIGNSEFFVNWTTTWNSCIFIWIKENHSSKPPPELSLVPYSLVLRSRGNNFKSDSRTFMSLWEFWSRRIPYFGSLVNVGVFDDAWEQISLFCWLFSDLFRLYFFTKNLKFYRYFQS